MRLITLLCCLGCLLNTAYAQKKPVADKRFAGLDTLIPGLLRDLHAAGCAVAIVDKDKVVYSKGFGFKDYESKTPVTENTLFAVGSTTKAFTAALLGQLMQDGKLDLDKPAKKYLPDLAFHNEYLTEHVTIRDMMTHRTGLPRHDYAWYGSSSPRDSLFYRIRFLEPSTELRASWQYNNFMYMAQGVIAEKLTGSRWEDLVRAKIFAPLNMTTANFSIDTMTRSADYALGYYEDKDTIKKLDFMPLDAMGPAGSINASVKEMANWVTTWINGGKFNGKEVIPASYHSQAISAQMSMGGGAPSKEVPDVFFSSYGLGWMLSSYRGHFLVEHGGNIDGFSANVGFFPADSIGIVVLTNQNNSALPGMLRNILSDRMLGLSPRNWSQMRKDRLAKAKTAPQSVTNIDSLNRKLNTRPSHPLADYAGVFEHPGYGKVTVRIKGDSLLFDYNKNQNKFFLDHYHYDVYSLKAIEGGESATKIRFNTDLKGNISSLVAELEPTVKPIEFEKLQPELAVTADELTQFVGEYTLSGLTAKIYTRGSILMLFVPGQPDYELVPAGKDEFNLKVAKGFSVKFERDANQKIVAMNFVQPNGVFKATRK